MAHKYTVYSQKYSVGRCCTVALCLGLLKPFSIIILHSILEPAAVLGLDVRMLIIGRLVGVMLGMLGMPRRAWR